MKNSNKPIVGITGGMGCGQSIFAKFLKEQGAKIISADRIAHRIVDENAEVKKELQKVFGRNIYTRNGKLKRNYLARIVFNDENKTRRLNQIVHPYMVGQIIDEIEKARESGKYPIVGIDAALIFEGNLEKIFNVIIVVTSKMSNRIERIKKRDNLPRKEILERIKKQIPIEEKAKWADFVIRNDESIDSLRNKAKILYRKLAGKRKGKGQYQSSNKKI